MSSRDRKYPIPQGYTWSHVKDAYVTDDGLCWWDHTNNMFHSYKDGVMLGTPVPVPAPTPAPESVEQEIRRKGLIAPRVTPADVDNAIAAEQFEQPVGTLLTICILTLRNGYTVTGESACASRENFDAELGRRIARDNAKLKIWPLLGYSLRQQLHQSDQ